MEKHDQVTLLPNHQEMIMRQRDTVVYHQRRAEEENEKLSKLLVNFGLTSVDIQVVPSVAPAPEQQQSPQAPPAVEPAKVLPLNAKGKNKKKL